ncbi:ribulokinase [Paenibacillus jamilae]|uniref:ribulokinase n=1 Tax=Paenibacillus TaxID=44249 RepID=UPI00077C9F93|nr:ribulokinase [Paenibacillus polymyxa]KYG96697.1 ribulokinase [Paenibacillus polymyxa]
MSKYTIGVDYGTESGRAVIVDLSDGAEIATHVTPYRHGVMDEVLPGSGRKLEMDWALEHPADYIEVLTISIPAVMKETGISPDDIIGIGIDFTACTMLPIDAQGQPLCFDENLKDNPHSWVKLWKHHAAQDEADRLNAIASQRGEVFLPRYGGKISSEWMIAKIWQTLNESPDIYNQTDRFVEATDWVISQLSGELKRNQCTAGYKSIYHHREGYPDREFFKALDPRLENLTDTKLRGEIYDLGARAGGLTEDMAAKLGLNPGTAVAVGNVDAHAAVPAVGVVTPGKLVMAMGTSICHMLLGEEEREVEGMCGVVENGIIPGYYGYEAGQSAVGDIFAWFVDHAVPGEVKEQAATEGVNVHVWLERKAAEYKPEIKVAASTQTPALGAAMFAAVAAGAEAEGYDDIVEAALHMARVRDESFKPIPENAAVYDKLYEEYSRLHDYFGRGGNPVMKRLKTIKEEARRSTETASIYF